MTAITKEHIGDYIPQKFPFIMIDEVVSCTDEAIVTQFLVQETNVFSENGVLREPALIENMAQTAAAQAGVGAKTKNESPKIGYIGAIKNLKINQLPKVGTTLRTYLTHESDFGDFSIVQATIKAQDEIIASCNLTIFLTQIPG